MQVQPIALNRSTRDILPRNDNDDCVDDHSMIVTRLLSSTMALLSLSQHSRAASSTTTAAVAVTMKTSLHAAATDATKKAPKNCALLSSSTHHSIGHALLLDMISHDRIVMGRRHSHNRSYRCGFDSKNILDDDVFLVSSSDCEDGVEADSSCSSFESDDDFECDYFDFAGKDESGGTMVNVEPDRSNRESRI